MKAQYRIIAEVADCALQRSYLWRGAAAALQLTEFCTQALRDTGGTGGGRHPQDFLMFCALVNKEAPRPDEVQQQEESPPHSLQVMPVLLWQQKCVSDMQQQATQHWCYAGASTAHTTSAHLCSQQSSSAGRRGVARVFSPSCSCSNLNAASAAPSDMSGRVPRDML